MSQAVRVVGTGVGRTGTLSLKFALEHKAQGRVFQTDVDRPARPPNVAEADWTAFTSRSVFEALYFDYTIHDV